MKWLPFLLLSLPAMAAERVVINEIHCDPPKSGGTEFVELHNAGDATAKLDGWHLEQFEFPAGTEIPPGGFLVVAQDPTAIGKGALGPLAGKLTSERGKLVLADASGKVIEEVRYATGFPWPAAAAGLGSSLERVHPSLDASEPSSWRSSGFTDAPPGKKVVLLSSGSAAWRWRKGLSEASHPREDWRRLDFAEDASWQSGRAGFGYGDNDDATVLADMQGQYSSIFLRHKFACDTAAPLLLRVRVDDGCIVWLDGRELARLHAPAGDSFDALAAEHEAADWEDVDITSIEKGSHVLAAQVWNSSRNSSDLSFDLSLQTADGATALKKPTPGARNSVFSERKPLSVDWVSHSPRQPSAGQSLVITARVPRATAGTLHVQIVEPGEYVRKADPDYEMRWQDFPMTISDGTLRAELPSEMQRNRRLIRYRITAMDGTMSVRLPYADDPCPNFACYVWNGPTPYAASPEPKKTPPLTFSGEMQSTLATFTLIANADDVRRSQWDSGALKRPMSGTFVFEGHVLDHMTFRNRGSASTYVSGKNKWGFRFLPTHELPMHDADGRRYARTWNSFAMNACSSPWVQETNRGMAGLDEVISARCYQLAGVPASDHIPVQLRVVMSKEDAAAQFETDTWGLYLAIEDVDSNWLDNHQFPQGVIWKPEDGVKHAPPGLNAPSLVEALTGAPQGKDREAGWRSVLDVQAYAGFHAINRFVSNVDLRPGANHAFYRHPERGWQPVPWDLDMQFIPKTHQPGYIDQARCLDIPAIALQYRNRAREILDLLGTDARPAGGQIGQLVADYSRRIAPPGHERNWAELDMCRWNFAPQTNAKGIFYRNPATQGMMGGNFTRTLSTADFAGFARYVVEFCTDSRPQKDYAVNDGDARGYGWGRVEAEARDKEIPECPTIKYTGPADHLASALTFSVSAFSDPQGAGTFAGTQWRVGEITRRQDEPWRYEIEPVWLGPEQPTQVAEAHIPGDVCKPNRTYRVRARHKDNTGRWSHWSEPVEFIPGAR